MGLHVFNAAVLDHRRLFGNQPAADEADQQLTGHHAGLTGQAGLTRLKPNVERRAASERKPDLADHKAAREGRGGNSSFLIQIPSF